MSESEYLTLISLFISRQSQNNTACHSGTGRIIHRGTYLVSISSQPRDNTACHSGTGHTTYQIQKVSGLYIEKRRIPTWKGYRTSSFPWLWTTLFFFSSKDLQIRQFHYFLNSEIQTFNIFKLKPSKNGFLSLKKIR